jgi:enediyne biosynthesis thioesterase
MGTYEYRHVVGFEETNLLGNVYFVNHLSWQGRCRELFLREHVPDVVAAFSEGLCLITRKCSCEYLTELSAFDEVSIRMSLGELVQNRMTLKFEYWRCRSREEELIARGEQQLICMRRSGKSLVAAEFPDRLTEALTRYRPQGDR